MQTRSTAFLIVMIAIAVVGVLAFLIAWLKRPVPGTGLNVDEPPRPWWENERGLSWGKVCLSLAALGEGVALLAWLVTVLATLPGDASGWAGNERAIYFLVIMAAIAAVGLVAFLIALISGGASEAAQGVEGAEAAPPRENQRALLWGKAFLSLTALAEVIVVLVWLVVHLSFRLADEPGWAGNTRAVFFLVIMAAIAAVGFVALVIYLLARHAKRPKPEVEASPPVVDTPSGLRLVGMLAPLVAFLLLAWIHLPKSQEYVLITRLIYPAAMAMALMLLFDKATRSWSVKSSLGSFRDWLFMDLMVFLLILGYLNLLSVEPTVLGDWVDKIIPLDPEEVKEYRPMFWDVLHLTLFFIVFWLLDRKVTRIRFLVGYGYLVLLPIQLLIWRAIQGVPRPDDYFWWGSLWPFFLWSAIFFVLEIITLIAVRRPDTSVVPMLKDIVYLIGVFILLIVAS